MEAMYQKYGEVAEFRIIYIKEAHAADSSWPVPYAVRKGLNQPTTYKERCTIATMLAEDTHLTIPMLVDEIDDNVNELYQALPNRVFLVRKDGTLAVAAARGPWGFPPALEEAEAWLAAYAASGEEPALAETRGVAADTTN
jgi:hypothetical protein